LLVNGISEPYKKNRAKKIIEEYFKTLVQKKKYLFSTKNGEIREIVDSPWFIVHGKTKSVLLLTMDHKPWTLPSFFRIFTPEWQKMKLY